METHSLRKVAAQQITSENFLPFGQVIFPLDDHVPFSTKDAQLQLKAGVPRFYIMRLYQSGRRFQRITRHQRCTQCLGSLGGKEWFLGVAPPNATPVPSGEDIMAFRIAGNCFIKLEVGTWHAGPYFDDDYIDFYNLELSDTNLVDHDTFNLLEQSGVEYEIV